MTKQEKTAVISIITDIVAYLVLEGLSVHCADCDLTEPAGPATRISASVGAPTPNLDISRRRTHCDTCDAAPIDVQDPPLIIIEIKDDLCYIYVVRKNYLLKLRMPKNWEGSSFIYDGLHDAVGCLLLAVFLSAFLFNNFHLAFCEPGHEEDTCPFCKYAKCSSADGNSVGVSCTPFFAVDIFPTFSLHHNSFSAILSLDPRGPPL